MTTYYCLISGCRYGNWGGNSATVLIPAFLRDLNGSAFQNILTTYTNGAGTPITNAFGLAGQVHFKTHL